MHKKPISTEETRMTQALEKMNHAIKEATIQTGKFLTFTLAEEEYGIGILKVKEIIGMMPITSVPRTPEFVKGVINLRGKVIPVMDLRVKFGMASIDYTDRTCIIVVEIDTDDMTIQIGIVVDTVSEVLNIKQEEIEDAPSFGTRLDTDYILGMAKIDSGVKILLDIDRVLSAKEIQAMEKTI
jgi:purine-binding chemotaxis protein CheW